MSDIRIVNPRDYENWDGWVGLLEDSSCFHSAGWCSVLEDSYGFRPVYFCLETAGNPVALIPVMEVRSMLTGRRAVSLPFSDYCEPLVAGNASLKEVLQQLIAFGKKSKWRFVEFRGGQFLKENFAASFHFLRHRIDLTRGIDSIEKRYRHSTRTNIRKAEREGVRIVFSRTPEAMEEFYRLNLVTRKRHGVPPQPLLFFRHLFDRVISRGQGDIVLAEVKKKNVAAALTLQFGQKIMYKYNASEVTIQSTRPNNLLIAEMVRQYTADGFRSFCFGRTDPSHTGLIQFKNGWATDETIINYHKFDLNHEVIVEEPPDVRGVMKRVFQAAPIPLLRAAGRLLYRHVG